MEKPIVAVIGGGAAGMMAAGTAASRGAQVYLFEKNEKLGRKIYITGKGRCNVCNACDVRSFLEHVPCNPRFLHSVLSAFSPQDTMDFFERLGVPLEVERGNRVFPASDKASDIIDALRAWNLQSGVKIIRATVQAIQMQEGTVCGVQTDAGKRYPANRVIVATGGVSYPLTGSTGDGYTMAAQAGHTVISPKASLVPLVCQEKDCADMMGLSLKNVKLSIYKQSKCVYEEQGELLFTHFGMSGPLVLSASAHLRKWEGTTYRAEIDLKPALSEETLNRRILSDFEAFKNHQFSNALSKLLPKKIIPIIIVRTQIPPTQKVHSITKEQRQRLLQVLKHFTLTITGTRPVSEAIITSGGVHVREIDPKTMESKKIRHLYFAGEVLDVDAYTGGYNLQIAWSTGYAAGKASVGGDRDAASSSSD